MPSARLAGRSFAAILTLAGLARAADGPKPGDPSPRLGDEFFAAGRMIHAGTPVVTWLDPGGYDAYRTDRRFAPIEASSFERSKSETLKTPNRFGLRRGGLDAAEVERVRGGGWDLPLLQGKVDQFVLHFDACGTSRKCFEVLQDERGLSVHFMLDLDGTIYQTLDLKERAFHATKANDRSIGIEIANIGTFAPDGRDADRVGRRYARDPDGRPRLVVPPTGLNPDRPAPAPADAEPLRPARPEPVVGRVQGQDLAMYDLTPPQYDALIRLTAALCRTFPKIRCDVPRDADGRVLAAKLDDDAYLAYAGILGHYHVQANKVDPGPAFDWDRLLDGARKLLAE